METESGILPVRRKHTELARSVSADQMGNLALEEKQPNGIHLLVPSLPAFGRKVSSLNALNLVAGPPSTAHRVSSATFYKQKLAETVEMPVKHLKKLKEQDLGSYQRETKHFSENTTMHGPKRVYKGKRWSFFFWTLMFVSSIAALCVQVYFLIDMYLSKPTVSQVSFGLNEKGVDFPVVTICPFNPIMKSRLALLNATGDFSEELLSYLLETNVEAPALYSSSNKTELRRGDDLYRQYMAKHPDFNLYKFFEKYGFQCHDLMRWCTFGGRQFKCCDFAEHILTPIGRCQRLDVRSSPNSRKWMMKQTAPGHNAGLQIILDSQQDEQFTLSDNIVASPLFEHGFRYYVHDSDSVPYLQSEGISVSPGMRVYSALSINKYVLLDANNWGHCVKEWPKDYIPPGGTNYSYTAASCTAICMAEHFVKHCNCSPSAYDINDRHDVCSPLQVVDCIDKYMKNGTDLDMPDCPQCKLECKNNVYQTFNSYGRDFSATSMKWLAKKDPSWTPEVIKTNFLTINIFFRDLSYTEYKQVPATSLTELLSNIGGNMGMFLGMSTITITEISLFLCKIFWIAFSRSRRNYMAEKKKREEDQDKEVEETVKEFKRIRSCNDLHSISNFKMDMYHQPSPPSPPSGDSLDSFGSEFPREKETDSGNGTDR